MAGLDQLLGLFVKDIKQQDVDSDDGLSDGDLGSCCDSDKYEEEVRAGMVEVRPATRTQLLFRCVFYVRMLMIIPLLYAQDGMGSSDDEGPPEGADPAHKPEALQYLQLLQLGDEAAPDAHPTKAFGTSLQQVGAGLQ